MATRVIPSSPIPFDESRFDRVDGQWVERPLPGAQHSDLQFALTVVLKRLAEPLGAVARQEWSLTKPDDTGFDQPDYMTADVLVTLPKAYEMTKRGHLIPPALLAVEIASPGQDNQIKKAELFHAWGVRHCWLINPETRICLEYHGGNEIIIAREELHAGELTIRTAEIFPQS